MTSSLSPTILAQGLGEVIVDNNDPTTYAEGDWKTFGRSDAYGRDAHYSRGSGVFTFPAALAPGRYQIHLWWPSFKRLAPDVQVSIQAVGGVEVVTVDQSRGAAQWRLLGTYDLDESALVRVHSGGDQTVCADAVRFESVVPPPDVPGVLLPPQELSASAEMGEVRLRWTHPDESAVALYKVYRSNDPNGGYLLLADGLTVTTYADREVTNGLTYYYKVTAADPVGNESDFSNVASATPQDLPPAAPTGLEAKAERDRVGLAWNVNAEGDLAGYAVYRATGPEGTFELLAPEVRDSYYVDQAVSSGLTYHYAVTALDLGGNESEASNVVSVTIQDPPPAIPTGLVASASDRAVSLKWNDNSEADLAGYAVYRFTGSENVFQRLADGLGVTSYTDETVSSDLTYHYAVTALDLQGNESDLSNVVSITVQDPPPLAPGGLVASSGDGVVNLSWNGNTDTDLSGYAVYRSTTHGSGYDLLLSGVAATTFSDNAVTNGTTYYYVVTALDTGGNESPFSGEVVATPSAPDMPPPSSVVLTWDPPSGNEDGSPVTDLAGYRVYHGTEPGVYSSVTDVGAQLQHIFESIPAGSNFFAVSAYDAAGNESALSNELVVTAE